MRKRERESRRYICREKGEIEGETRKEIERVKEKDYKERDREKRFQGERRERKRLERETTIKKKRRESKGERL